MFRQFWSLLQRRSNRIIGETVRLGTTENPRWMMQRSKITKHAMHDEWNLVERSSQAQLTKVMSTKILLKA